MRNTTQRAAGAPATRRMLYEKTQTPTFVGNRGGMVCRYHGRNRAGSGAEGRNVGK